MTTDTSFWVYAEMMAKYVDCPMVNNIGENGSGRIEQDRTTTYVARMPQTPVINRMVADKFLNGRQPVRNTPIKRQTHMKK